MPRNRSNRIEVDLNLLQSENVQKLREFGTQFDKSIDKLASMLGSYADQVAGATETVNRAGRLGPNASRADDVRLSGPTARMGGEPPRIPSWAQYGHPLNAPPPGAPSLPEDSSAAPAPSNQFEIDYAQATKRLGEHVPVGLRQALGYAAEGVIKIPGVSQERAEELNDKLFALAAIRANVMLGMGHIQNIFGSIAAPTMLGQQLGSSREGGLFGTGFLSPAFRQGFRENFQAMLAGDFGFNPNYSVAQARAARETLQQYGYSGQTSDFLADQLKQLQIHQGLEPQAVMAILDPLMRFGGDENMSQLLSVLKQIPDAAKAAHMNLADFTQQLISTSQEVASSTGMTVGGAANALQAFSATTGLAPSRASDLFSNPQNLILASGMTGQSITSLMEGRNRMAPRMAFGVRMFQSFTGGLSGEQLAQLRKHDWTRYQQIMNGAWLAYSQNKEIFGGFSPRELINMQVRNNGRLLSHTSIQEELPYANSINRIEQLLGGWGGKSGQWLTNELQTYIARHPDATVAQVRKEALDRLARVENTSQARTAREITKIDLTPEAKKWFKLLNYDKPSSNSAPSFERSALNIDSEVQRFRR